MNDPGGVEGRPAPVRGILFAHADMAKGMVEAVRRIAGGDQDALVPLSNEGRGLEEMARVIDEVAGEGPVVVFTDLQAGSCSVAALRCCRDRPERVVVTGVNLPILLDFVFHRDMPLEELIPRLIRKGTDSIRVPGVEEGRR